MIGSQLTINAHRHPDAIALVYGARRYSYAALNERSCRLANALTTIGIGPGDHVTGLINNCSQFIEIFFALAKLGAVFVPINFRLAPREVGELLDDCRPKLLFLGESVAQAKAELQRAGAMPPHQIWVRDRADNATGAGDSPYEMLLRSHPANEPELAVGREAGQLLLYSSGTTGRPKGAIWTHGTTLASSLAKIIDFEISGDDVTVVFSPLFHVGPLMDLAVPLLLRGARLVIGATTGFDPSALMRTIAAERATLVTVYPTMWRRLLALEDLDTYDCASLRLLFTGGEPISIPLLREIYARFPMAGFINTYGSTEGGPITTFLPTRDRERKIGSVGRPAFSVDVRIVDQAGAPVPPGTVGELLVRSPFVCNGYWGRSGELMHSQGGAWWHTGDLAWRDDEGFIWIAGRKKDMIISGAENIYPVEIEQVIAALDGVVDVAVVGVPDPEWGESVAAYVVRAPGSMLDGLQIIDQCRRNLASYKKPRHVFFVDSLPRTTVNKVSKDRLRALFRRD
jgi:fatty-acyl-CoA synthase